jgi:hypothetical protein
LVIASPEVIIIISLAFWALGGLLCGFWWRAVHFALFHPSLWWVFNLGNLLGGRM